MLQLTRTVTETTLDGNQLWLVRFEITQAGLGADPYVFLHQYVAVNPYVDQADTEFIGVCSLTDQADYPVAQPTLETPNPFFRSNVATVYCISTDQANDLIQIVEEELLELVEAVTVCDEMEIVEELWVGSIPAGSSSSSSSSNQPPVATGPENLVVTGEFNTMRLTWDPFVGVYKYQIVRRAAGATVWTTLSSDFGETVFKDYTPDFDIEYSYRVRGRYDNGQWTDWSTIETGKLLGPIFYSPDLYLLDGFYSRTGGQFLSENNSRLSVADAPTLRTGNTHYWGAAWVYADSLSVEDSAIYARWGGTPELKLSLFSYQTIMAVRSDSAFPIVQAPPIPLATWTFLFYFHNPDSKLIGLIVDNVLYTNTYTGSLLDYAQATAIGAYGSGSAPFNGLIDNVVFGKPPTALGDGTIGSLAHEIATALFRTNYGLPFQSITSQQRTNWGIVSGWIDKSLTADVFGANTLTNVNSVTPGAGRVNAVAVENDPIYFWEDLTINHTALQPSLTSRPLFITNYARFDGLNDSYTLDDLTIDTSSADLFFVVEADDDVGMSDRVLLASTTSFAVFWIDNGYWGLTIDDVDARPQGYLYSDNLTDKVVLRYSFTGLSRRLYVNGALAWEMTATFSDVYTFDRIGISLGGNPWKGKMWHLSSFSGLNEAKRLQIESYLMDRYL